MLPVVTGERTKHIGKRTSQPDLRKPNCNDRRRTKSRRYVENSKKVAVAVGGRLADYSFKHGQTSCVCHGTGTRATRKVRVTERVCHDGRQRKEQAQDGNKNKSCLGPQSNEPYNFETVYSGKQERTIDHNSYSIGVYGAYHCKRLC